MILFALLAAGLILLALLFIVPPILSQRTDNETLDENQVNLALFHQQLEELNADLAAGALDQDQYAVARRDLEKGLLLDTNDGAVLLGTAKSGRWAAPLLAVLVPALAIGLYLQVGDYRAITPPTGSAMAQAHGEVPSLEVLVARLAERMQSHPEDLQGWMMLGRSYLAIDQKEQAVVAYAQAFRLAPREPEVLLAYAQALAQVAKSLGGKPAELIRTALEVAPTNPNALWMMGLVEIQQGAPAQAIAHWTRLQDQLAPDSENAQTLHRLIAETRQQAGIPAESATPSLPSSAPVTTVAAPPSDTAGPPARAAAIQVQVTIGADMQGRFSPGDTLFVFARALSGPPMPLAVQRLKARDLPITLTLDDRMAMTPQMRLSNFPQVVVGARITRSGNAIPQSGDLEGEVKPVTPGQPEPVQVLIDRVHP